MFGSLQNCFTPILLTFPGRMAALVVRWWNIQLWLVDGRGTYWLSASLRLRQEVISAELIWLTFWSFKRNVWRRRVKRAHQFNCELARGASYSYATLLCIFLPLSLSVPLCVSLSVCLFRVYLPLPVIPARDIYQMSGQRPSLSTGLDQIYSGLRALFSTLWFEERVRTREGILTLWLEDIWDRGAGEVPTGHIPLSSIVEWISFCHWSQSSA